MTENLGSFTNNWFGMPILKLALICVQYDSLLACKHYLNDPISGFVGSAAIRLSHRHTDDS